MQSSETMNAQRPVHMQGKGKMTPTGGLPKAKEPKYPPYSHVQVLADHMDGMKDAHAVVVAAYDRTAYAVDVVGTDGKVYRGHKWAIADEMREGRGQLFVLDDTVQLARGHIAAMAGKNAPATIVEIHPGPVYMIDYTPTNGGEAVKNHQWVVEDELAPDSIGSMPQ